MLLHIRRKNAVLYLIHIKCNLGEIYKTINAINEYINLQKN